MRCGIYVLLLLLPVHAAVAEAAGPPAAKATIRTFNYAGISAEELAAARLEAAGIFKRADITLEWIDCRVPATDGAACTEPLLDGRDLMLRLVDREPADARRLVALGESMLDRERRGGVLMTVDLPPVRSIAGRTATPLATLLGRAIAHEIGHLLLGSAEHPRRGLMRATWSHEELRGLKPAHWGFSAREAAQMRQTLRSKSRTAD